MMVVDAIFIVKFNTRLQKKSKFYLSPLIIQIVNIDVSFVGSIAYLRSEVLIVGLGSHFQSEIQYPASEKRCKFHLSAHNLWQGCQIAIIEVVLDRSTQYLCNEVLNNDSGSHFQREINTPKKSIKISLKSAYPLTGLPDCR